MCAPPKEASKVTLSTEIGVGVVPRVLVVLEHIQAGRLQTPHTKQKQSHGLLGSEGAS